MSVFSFNQINSFVAPLVPSQFQHISFSPALLLPVAFDVLVTTEPGYADGCAGGFACYFEDMREWNDVGDDFVFVDRVYTWAEVERIVCDDLLETCVPPGVTPAPLPFNVGYTLGWLSALALTDRALALRGLSLLSALVDHLVFCQSSAA
jgi:hypothetical protein